MKWMRWKWLGKYVTAPSLSIWKRGYSFTFFWVLQLQRFENQMGLLQEITLLHKSCHISSIYHLAYWLYFQISKINLITFRQCIVWAFYLQVQILFCNYLWVFVCHVDCHPLNMGEEMCCWLLGHYLNHVWC